MNVFDNAMRYNHTQIGYLMVAVTVAVLAFFVWMYSTAAAEPVSVDSGTNLAVTAFMAVVILVLASFSTLTVSIDDQFLRIKFGYGIVTMRFRLREIPSAKHVRNHWYYGWGIRLWFWPRMWIFNVSGFDAVELTMSSGQTYRIGTDEPEALVQTLQQSLQEND